MTKAKGPDTGDAALATAFPVNHALPMHLNLRKMVASEAAPSLGTSARWAIAAVCKSTNTSLEKNV